MGHQLNASAISLAPVHDVLINFAAHGELVHNDDTTMKVLSFLKEQNPQSSRKGIFSSGIVSKWQDHHIALFMTGNQHAGENLNDILKHRATGLSPPVQMCDGASRNESKDYETILVLCERALKHAILHRKNALFYRTQHGAYVGDLFMSLIHTCQLSGVNPLDYLTYLLKNAGKLEKSPDHYMPWNYNQFLWCPLGRQKLPTLAGLIDYPQSGN
jgi:hypothetical protein